MTIVKRSALCCCQDVCFTLTNFFFFSSLAPASSPKALNQSPHHHLLIIFHFFSARLSREPNLQLLQNQFPPRLILREIAQRLAEHAPHQLHAGAREMETLVAPFGRPAEGALKGETIG